MNVRDGRLFFAQGQFQVRTQVALNALFPFHCVSLCARDQYPVVGISYKVCGFEVRTFTDGRDSVSVMGVCRPCTLLFPFPHHPLVEFVEIDIGKNGRNDTPLWKVNENVK